MTTGSRRWSNRTIVHQALSELPQTTRLVNGGQGYRDQTDRKWYGADVLCTQFALVHDLDWKEYPAAWGRFGRSAGPKRNVAMLQAEQPDEVYAFRLPGESNGTDHMMRIALEADIPVHLYYLYDPVSDLYSVGKWLTSWGAVQEILDTRP